MRRQSLLVAATGASVLVIALVSAATAFVVMNHEEKARVVGGLTIDDGSAEQEDGDRSLILRMADALAGKLLDGWESHTAQIAGSGTVTGGGTGTIGGSVGTYSGSMTDILQSNGGLTVASNTGFRLGGATIGNFGNGSPSFGGTGFGGGGSGFAAFSSPGTPGGGGPGTGTGTGDGTDSGETGNTPREPYPAPPPENLDTGGPLPPTTNIVPIENGPPGLQQQVPGEDNGGGITQVPEPGSLALLGGGLSLLGAVAWRRRRRQ